MRKKKKEGNEKIGEGKRRKEKGGGKELMK